MPWLETSPDHLLPLEDLEDHDVTVPDHDKLGPGLQAESGANFLWNHDLPLGRQGGRGGIGHDLLRSVLPVGPRWLAPRVKGSAGLTANDLVFSGSRPTELSGRAIRQPPFGRGRDVSNRRPGRPSAASTGLVRAWNHRSRRTYLTVPTAGGPSNQSESATSLKRNGIRNPVRIARGFLATYGRVKSVSQVTS